MPSIEYDAVSSRYSLPTYRLKNAVYPGNITLEATPWRGKLKRLLRGVSRPMDTRPEGPPSWDEFSKEKHFRAPQAIVSLSGVMLEVFKDSIDSGSLVPITDEDELRAVWEDRIAHRSVHEVDAERRHIAYYPTPDYAKTGNGSLISHFCYFWKVEVAEDGPDKVTLRFKPSLWAQLRHLCMLRPWTYTINRHAYPA